MNGTALRKPTARRVVGMVAGIVIIALGIALFKQKTAYEMQHCDWSSDVCSSDLISLYLSINSLSPAQSRRIIGEKKR